MSKVLTDRIIDETQKAYKLNNINRFQTEYHLHNETVASHSFYVSLFVLKLSNYYKFDVNKVLKMAIVHDLPESFIGDFPYHIKQEQKMIKNAFDNLDSIYIKKYSNYIIDCENLIKEFNDCLTVEAIVANYCDMLSSLLFCETELALGNTYFEYKKKQKYLKCLEYEGMLKGYMICE